MDSRDPDASSPSAAAPAAPPSEQPISITVRIPFGADVSLSVLPSLTVRSVVEEASPSVVSSPTSTSPSTSTSASTSTPPPFCLVHSGHILDDALTLRACNVSDNAVLHLMARPSAINTTSPNQEQQQPPSFSGRTFSRQIHIRMNDGRTATATTTSSHDPNNPNPFTTISNTTDPNNDNDNNGNNDNDNGNSDDNNTAHHANVFVGHPAPPSPHDIVASVLHSLGHDRHASTTAATLGLAAAIAYAHRNDFDPPAASDSDDDFEPDNLDPLREIAALSVRIAGNDSHRDESLTPSPPPAVTLPPHRTLAREDTRIMRRLAAALRSTATDIDELADFCDISRPSAANFTASDTTTAATPIADEPASSASASVSSASPTSTSPTVAPSVSASASASTPTNDKGVTVIEDTFEDDDGEPTVLPDLSNPGTASTAQPTASTPPDSSSNLTPTTATETPALTSQEIATRNAVMLFYEQLSQVGQRLAYLSHACVTSTGLLAAMLPHPVDAAPSSSEEEGTGSRGEHAPTDSGRSPTEARAAEPRTERARENERDPATIAMQSVVSGVMGLLSNALGTGTTTTTTTTTIGGSNESRDAREQPAAGTINQGNDGGGEGHDGGSDGSSGMPSLHEIEEENTDEDGDDIEVSINPSGGNHNNVNTDGERVGGGDNDDLPSLHDVEVTVSVDEGGQGDASAGNGDNQDEDEDEDGGEAEIEVEVEIEDGSGGDGSLPFGIAEIMQSIEGSLNNEGFLPTQTGFGAGGNDNSRNQPRNTGPTGTRTNASTNPNANTATFGFSLGGQGTGSGASAGLNDMPFNLGDLLQSLTSSLGTGANNPGGTDNGNNNNNSNDNNNSNNNTSNNDRNSARNNASAFHFSFDNFMQPMQNSNNTGASTTTNNNSNINNNAASHASTFSFNMEDLLNGSRPTATTTTPSNQSSSNSSRANAEARPRDDTAPPSQAAGLADALGAAYGPELAGAINRTIGEALPGMMGILRDEVVAPTAPSTNNESTNNTQHDVNHTSTTPSRPDPSQTHPNIGPGIAESLRQSGAVAAEPLHPDAMRRNNAPLGANAHHTTGPGPGLDGREDNHNHHRNSESASISDAVDANAGGRAAGGGTDGQGGSSDGDKAGK